MADYSVDFVRIGQNRGEAGRYDQACVSDRNWGQTDWHRSTVLARALFDSLTVAHDRCHVVVEVPALQDVGCRVVCRTASKQRLVWRIDQDPERSEGRNGTIIAVRRWEILG